MRFRTVPALIVTALTVTTLVACSSNTSTCEFPSGDASSVVTVSGEVGSTPRVQMPTPIVAKGTESSVIVEGEGDLLTAGQTVLAEVAMFNGTTGDPLQDTGYQGGVLLTVGTDSLPPVTEALTCARDGSRHVVVGTAADTHDSQAIPSLGIAADDSIVFVVDVLESFLAKADGTPRLGGNDDPTVVLHPSGQPGVTIPQQDPPTEFVESVLKQGDGATVEEGDQVVLHYSGFTWADNEMFDSSWERGEAASWELRPGALIEGFYDGIVGSTVGSQLLLVIPPEMGYGDRATASIPAGSTLVFVVDILGIIE